MVACSFTAATSGGCWLSRLGIPTMTRRNPFSLGNSAALARQAGHVPREAMHFSRSLQMRYSLIRTTSQGCAMSIPDASLGAIGAALIAGIVALLGLIIGKENKTSEFRQAWIDGLRSDLAHYIAHVVVLMGTVRIEGRDRTAWVNAKDHTLSLNQCASNIRLRLNPDEEQSATLLASLNAIETAFEQRPLIDEETIAASEKQLLIDSQRLLKREWTRVRDGERIFRITRFAFLMAVCAGTYLLFYISLYSDNSSRITTYDDRSSVAQKPSTQATSPTRESQLTPSLTGKAQEVLQLRAECEKLGEELLRDVSHGALITVSQLSSYNPKTNRCHVTLTSQHADLSDPQEYLVVLLYDGQTKELLATYKIERGKKTGLGFKNGEVGFEATKNYVDEMMKDE
jgi:hypothetical protein